MAAQMNFTDASVAALLPRPGKTLDVRDAKLPGLYVRVQASGKRSFYFVYSRGGRPRWYRIGPSGMGASEARAQAKVLIGEVAKGGDPQAERRADKKGATFEQLHARYVEEHAKKHNKSWKQADRLIRNNVYPKWATLPVTGITRADVRKLIGSIEAPQTANQVRAAISAVLTFAVDAELVALNVCRGVKDNPTRERERVLAAAEVPQFWAGCEQVDPVKAAALRTILLTGQRPGEVAHMRFEHIKSGWWELPGLPQPELSWPGVKNQSSHRVYLAPAVRELIGAGDVGFVFSNTRGNAIDGLDAAMRAISEAQGFAPAVRPHDLRRSFGSMVTGRRHGRDAMDRLLNHRERSVTDVYDRHVYSAEDQRIAEDVAAAIMRLAEGQGQDDNVVALRQG
jgi:integrase